MSLLKLPSPSKLFVSMLFSGREEPEETTESIEAFNWLQHTFGDTDSTSAILPFNYTDYYIKEMGPHIWRRVFSFAGLQARDRLVDIKLACVQFESRFTDTQNKRHVNLDPGLVSVENFILASGKNIQHRVYLSQGIFADLTLIYRNRQFQSLPWTYPDYASGDIHLFVTRMREQLLKQIRDIKSET